MIVGTIAEKTAYLSIDTNILSCIQRQSGDKHVRRQTCDRPSINSAEHRAAEVSGSTGLTGAADTVMVLKKEPNRADAILYLRGRDIEEAELALAFDKQTGCWSLI